MSSSYDCVDETAPGLVGGVYDEENVKSTLERPSEI